MEFCRAQLHGARGCPWDQGSAVTGREASRGVDEPVDYVGLEQGPVEAITRSGKCACTATADRPGLTLTNSSRVCGPSRSGSVPLLNRPGSERLGPVTLYPAHPRWAA